MSASSKPVLDAVDDLCQLRDELRVIWLAIGNTADQGDGEYSVEIREHVNGIANRVATVISNLEMRA